MSGGGEEGSECHLWSQEPTGGLSGMVEGSLHLLDLLEIMASHHLEGESVTY